jgi:endonuclease V-like protein UPF0215 family
MMMSFKRDTLTPKKFRSIKPEIRVLGVDDGIFVPHTKGTADVVGVVYRGGYWLDGVMRTQVTIDGMEATEKIAVMIKKSPHYEELRVVILNGITFAGFNVVDINKLSKSANLPVIAVTREKPDLQKIRKALENLPERERRWQAIESAGKIIDVQTRNTEEAVYMQIAGVSQEDAKKILKSTSTQSNIPEALRVAHIIATGLTRLEEKI